MSDINHQETQCRAAAEEIEKFVAELCKPWTEFYGHADEIATIIARHLQPNRYGEGFAAGVEKAAQKCERDKSWETAGRYHASLIRALTPHGDDHG